MDKINKQETKSPNIFDKFERVIFFYKQIIIFIFFKFPNTKKKGMPQISKRFNIFEKLFCPNNLLRL